MTETKTKKKVKEPELSEKMMDNMFRILKDKNGRLGFLFAGMVIGFVLAVVL